MSINDDIKIFRELAYEYREICESSRQKELRGLWRKHNSLEKTEIPVVCSWDEGSNLADELLATELRCSDQRLVKYELFLRNSLYHNAMGDDWIYEPWLTVPVIKKYPQYRGRWGQIVEEQRVGQAYITRPVIHTMDDMNKLVYTSHEVDEAATADLISFYEEALDGVLEISVNRRPIYHGLGASDLSTSLAELLGFENMMVAMVEEPELVHALVTFLRDAVLKQYDETTEKRDWTAHGGWWENQGTPYCYDLPDPNPQLNFSSSKELWMFMAAQEFTLISPEMFEEFMLQYQRPIMERFGLVTYGCCEDLTDKISLLKTIPNLRRIGIAPVANVEECAKQIEDKYVMSWRPNPATVCAFFDKEVVRSQIRRGLEESRGCRVDIMLKDVSTVQGEPARLFEWVKIVRDEVSRIS